MRAGYQPFTSPVSYPNKERKDLCMNWRGDSQDWEARVSVWMMISGKQNRRIGNKDVPTPREVYPCMEWYCHGPAL